MVQCFVPGCRHQFLRENCKPFYIFPKNPAERQRWINLIRRQDREPNHNSKVCSCHFKDGKKESGPVIFKRNADKIFDKPSCKRKKPEIPLKKDDFKDIKIVTICTELEDHKKSKNVVDTSTNSLLEIELEAAKAKIKSPESKLAYASVAYQYGQMKEETDIMETGLPSKAVVDVISQYSSIMDQDLSVKEEPSMSGYEVNNSEIKVEMGQISDFPRNDEDNNKNKEPFLTSVKTEISACGEKFNDISTFEEHLSMHKKMFEENMNMESHLTAQTAEELYNCEHCEQKFQDGGALKEHLGIHTVEMSYDCEKCGKKFDCYGVLKNDLRTHVEECKHCKKKCKGHDGLKIHLRIHTEQKKIHECKSCGKCYKLYGNFKKHLRTHKTEECEYCKQKFIDHQAFNTHIETHKNQEERYECTHCEKHFHIYSTLKTHLRAKHIMECEQCKQTFESIDALEDHRKNIHLITRLRKHATEKCEHCGRRFKVGSDLKMHMRIHKEISPYECQYCGKRFKQKGYLKTHIWIHAGEAPFACKECGQTFVQRCTLKKHKKIHTEIKAVEFEHCGETFEQMSKLEEHMEIHSEEKPHDFKNHLIESGGELIEDTAVHFWTQMASKLSEDISSLLRA